MQLFILLNEATTTIEVSPSDDVYRIKELIQERQSVPIEDQVLYLNGRPLDDDEQLLSEVEGFQADATINLSLRLRGGKVHGSLARAGKVKGQTPKVEKQEKRKKKTGRAKRRMLYNKRFVNVVATFGRRRGPNANAGQAEK